MERGVETRHLGEAGIQPRLPPDTGGRARLMQRCERREREDGALDLRVDSNCFAKLVAAVHNSVPDGLGRAGRPRLARQLAEVVTQLRLVRAAVPAVDVAAVGDDPAPSPETYLAVMSAKAEITEAGVEVCDLAMDVAGGSAFFKGSVIERCYRDIRAAKFHPLTPEDTLVETGRHALGIKGLLA